MVSEVNRLVNQGQKRYISAMSNDYQAKINKLKNSEVEIELQVSKEKLEEWREKILKKYRQNLELPGFRKGNVPEKMVIEKIGEAGLLEEAAEEAIREIYPQVLSEHNIQAISRPEVTIIKIARGNDLGVKIKTAVVPEIKLSDYKKIASEKSNKISDPEVTEKEVDEVIESLRQAQKTEDGKMPEINDDFVRGLGEFKDMADFRTKIKENLTLEKKHKARSRDRMAVMDKIIKESEIELPEILVEAELEKMFAQFKEEIETAGMQFKDYLAKSGANEEKIRNDWKPQAEKRAQIQLILNKIAGMEKIEADQTAVLQEVEKIMSQYPGADRERAKIYVETILINEAVFEFLEKLGK